MRPVAQGFGVSIGARLEAQTRQVQPKRRKIRRKGQRPLESLRRPSKIPKPAPCAPGLDKPRDSLFSGQLT